VVVVVALLLALGGSQPGCKRLQRQGPGEEKTLPAGADPAARRGGAQAADPHIYAETRSYMGTLFRVVIALRGDPKTEAGREDLTESRRRAVEAVRAAFAEVVRLESLLSSYQVDSLISRINAAAAQRPTRAVKVPQEIFNLILQSIQLSRALEGAFDITFAPLARLYRPPRKGQPALVPGPAELRKGLALVGSKHIGLDYDKVAVRLGRPGMRIGLGAIAKGYAVDCVVSVLRAQGQMSFIVDGGGDLYVSGRHPERPWRVGIKDPGKPATYFATLSVQGKAVVTSGRYERFFVKDGKRYHHILDPRTGRPAVGLASVTVVAPKAALADALATGVFVLGPHKGLEAIKRFAKVEALLVTTSGKVLMTPGLKGVIKHRPPTRPDK
jgi:thiamine biosynthesis lipoprotein